MSYFSVKSNLTTIKRFMTCPSHRTIDNSTNPANVLSPDQGTYLNHTMTNSTPLKGMNFSNKEK